MKKDYIGFGYNPHESDNHFYVVIDADSNVGVSIYERYEWDEEGEQVIRNKDVLKLKISKYKWSKLAPDVAKEFNRRLKLDKKPIGRFAVGGIPVEKLLGKELMVLLWGVENNDPHGIPVAIRNWLGLQPEERWWLYTMTNASTGGINDKKGWRTALRYALCENPVDDDPQQTLTDLSEGGWS